MSGLQFAKVTDDGIKKLQEALPNRKIEHWHVAADTKGADYETAKGMDAGGHHSAADRVVVF